MLTEFVPRRKPLANNTDLIWYLLAVIILGIVFSLPISNLTGTGPNLLIYLVGTGAIEALIIWDMWKLMRGKQLLNRGSAIATAKIIAQRLNKEPNWSVYSQVLTGTIPTRYTKCYVRFEFEAIQAVHAPKVMRLEAQVEKDLYERLTPGTTVQIRYATQDPRVVLLEGE